MRGRASDAVAYGDLIPEEDVRDLAREMAALFAGLGAPASDETIRDILEDLRTRRRQWFGRGFGARFSSRRARILSVVPEATRSLTLASVAACVRARHERESVSTLRAFLGPLLSGGSDPRSAGRSEAAELLAEALGEEISAWRGVDATEAMQIAALLERSREALTRPREEVTTDAAKTTSITEPTPTDNYRLYQPFDDIYSPIADSVPRDEHYIKTEKDVEQLAKDFIRQIGGDKRDPAPLLRVLVAVARAWLNGQPLPFVLEDERAVSTPASGIPFREAAAAVGHRAVEGPSAEERPPLPELSAAQLEAIRQRARKAPWNERGDDKRSPFEWVRDNYGEWIPGILQSHLKADPSLYRAFARRVSRKGLPEWLDVPTEDDARLRGLSASERQAVESRRRGERERKRLQRRRIRPPEMGQ